MANTIDLVTKFAPYVDEQFKNESKLSMLTNQDFDWTGAHTIKVYKIGTSQMNDYDRAGEDTATNWSRFGPVAGLDATTEEMTLTKDRSFTFAIDKLDTDETAQQLAGATALSRQDREVVIPEVDSYVYGVMATKAGTKAAAVALTAENIYTEILKASETLDDAEVPETERVLLVTPAVYALMKQCPEIVLDTDVGQEMRVKGVIANLDGASVVKVPKVRLPENFGFMLAHPSATVAPVKLEDYRVHQDPPGLSGALVEGRICYDAFVLDNKTKAIYYQPVTAGAG
ncbi:hypothetical protein MCG44_07070 [Lawsonibacter sp. OA9]|uniref:hypothetical protein n=1 Tax=Lawsonibacter sp. OA9 TaxID=2914163 RepID=UPI001F071138|nr:hypothetical protein [Lawsonibacter sp. OA9]MCH1979507.1 hypothetical protein [Lawsonibacter sp. OA9]